MLYPLYTGVATFVPPLCNHKTGQAWVKGAPGLLWHWFVSYRKKINVIRLSWQGPVNPGFYYNPSPFTEVHKTQHITYSSDTITSILYWNTATKDVLKTFKKMFFHILTITSLYHHDNEMPKDIEHVWQRLSYQILVLYILPWLRLRCRQFFYFFQYIAQCVFHWPSNIHLRGHWKKNNVIATQHSNIHFYTDVWKNLSKYDKKWYINSMMHSRKMFKSAWKKMYMNDVKQSFVEKIYSHDRRNTFVLKYYYHQRIRSIYAIFLISVIFFFALGTWDDCTICSFLYGLYESWLFFSIDTMQSLVYANGWKHYRDQSGYGLSQWETALHCNGVSHWLSPYPERPLLHLLAYYSISWSTSRNVWKGWKC